MKRKGEITQSITFAECIALVACPYWLCRAAKGKKCIQKGGKGTLDYPHGSRARAALDMRYPESAVKTGRVK